LAPLLPARPQLKKPGHASDDEQEMGHAPNRHHHRLRPTNMARAQKRPKLYRPFLEEMSHEQIEAVPGRRYDDPNAKPPGTVSSSEHDDSHINQRLEHMQKAELGNKEGRNRQRENEEPDSNRNRHAYPARTTYRIFSHIAFYGEAA
jgi:hypothetical protein